jgi:tetratricopeptide (TPR) repeat protein
VKFSASRRLVVALVLLAGFALDGPLAAQAQQPAEVSDPRGEAYYHFSLAHLYRQLAMQFVRQEYVTKSIEEFQAAIAADPESTYLREELIKLYASVNRLDDAVTEANKVLARDPESFEMHKLLGRIYQNYSRDRQTGVNEDMLRKALAEFEKALSIQPDDFESLVDVAGLYRASGQTEKARAALEKALAQQPNSAEALTSLAGIYLEEGKAEQGVEALERAMKTGDGDRRLLQMLGAAYEQTGRHDEAAAVFGRLIEDIEDTGGNTLPLRRQLARSLTLAGELDQAREQYELLLEAEPREAEYYLRLSQIHREKRRFSEAWESLKQAQDLDPASLEIKYNAVMLYEAERRYDEAARALEAILEETRRPTYEARDGANRSMFLEHLGAIHRQREDFDAAIAVYKQIGELNPDAAPRVRALTVEAHRSARAFSAALTESEQAFAQFPDDRGLQVQRATLLAENGRAPEGADLLKRLLDGGERDLEVYLSLGQVYEKGKMFDEAVSALERARDLAQGPRQTLGVKFSHASVLERAKRFDEAESKFRELLEEDPDNAGALNYLGYMLADRNVKLDEAHDMIQKALDLEPDNGAYLDSLGWVYYRQGKLDLAERYLLRSLEQYSRDPVVHSHLGDVYFQQGRTDDARRHWQRGLEEWRTSAPAEQDRAEISKLVEKLEKLGVKVSKAGEGEAAEPERKERR